MTTAATCQGRIPESLKAVFLASNNGEEVYVPPATANKIYQRGHTQVGSEKKTILSKPQFARFESPNAGQVSYCYDVYWVITWCSPYGSIWFVSRLFLFLQISPQALFLLKLKERGYFPRNYSSKRSGYHNAPTEHQLASYGCAIVDAIKQNRAEDLRRLLEAGLSPNACNEHGESILHMVCRHGKADLFRILVAFDVDLQQTDDYGRTAMHDACWAANPSFEIVQWLIKSDPTFLFLYDARGSLPLSYVTKANWAAWREYLEDTINELFPRGKEAKLLVPYICTLKPNSRPVPDPKYKIDPILANMVASGAMSPYDAIMSMEESDDETTVACSEYDDDSDSSFLESETEFDSDDEEELYCIAGGMRRMTLGTIEED